MRSPLLMAKAVAATALCHPAVGRVIGLALGDRIPNRGCVIDTSGEQVLPSIKAMLFWRIYESAEIRFVQRYLRRDLDVVELGASLGVVTSQIARRIGSGRKLVCVEANPTLLAHIRRNVARNAPAVRPVIVHAAVDYSPRPGGVSELHLGASNVGSRIGETRGGAGSLEVPATTLAALLRQHEVGDYAMVCDIEGSEAGIIDDDGAALSGCRQIIIELHSTRRDGRAIGVDDLVRGLGRHGFSVRDAYGAVHVMER